MKNNLFRFKTSLSAAFFFAAFLLSIPAAAQQNQIEFTKLTLKSPVKGAESVKVDDGKTPSNVRHVTLELMQSQEGRDAVKLYHELRAAGKIPFARKGASPPLGTIRTFSVRDTRVNDQTFLEIEFEKKAEGPRVDIWVATAELANGHVLESEIERIRVLSSESTGFSSFDSEKGIVENNETVFGDPPDVDGDQILDILLLDILDDYPASSAAILGFFDPANLSGQNLADIVYLDTFPGLVDNNGNRGSFDEPGHTLAHEYEHLIWVKVNGSGDDTTFINEGLAEWGEVVNGFTARFTHYFQEATERAQPLLGWRGFGNPKTLNDYQRAGIFSNYMAERIGVLATGSIARSISLGINNYSDVLMDNGLSMDDVVLDFHTANLLNDRSVDPAFGYTVPQYAVVKVVTILEIDGSTATSTSPSPGTLQPGAVFYFRWNDVANSQIDVTGDETKLMGRFILQTFSGNTSVTGVAIGGEGNFFEGDYRSITLILTNVDFFVAKPTPYDFFSTWQEPQPEFVTQEIIYDTGSVGSLTIQNESFNAFLLGMDFMTANRFEVPAFGELGSVSIDHVYLSEFINTGIPSNSPRDFTLHIWAENAQGEPGDELLAIELDDVTSPGFFTNFDFQTIPLGAFSSELANLPDVIFVGVGNAGTDPNDIVMTISDFPTGTTPSYMFNPAFAGSHWARFDQISFVEGGALFAQTVLPIRASFIIPAEPVSVDELVEIPATVTLHQNYPNPFNPSTTFEYTLSQSGNVLLVVYDMLGRRVATVVDDFKGVGIHQITFDASDLASGLYLYSLETDAVKVTRTMTLLR